MVVLIALPFAALIIAICVIRMLRGFREVRELRSRFTPLTVPSSHRKPSDVFHDRTWLPLCQSIGDAACASLNRPLTAIERRTIWRTRSPLVLEVVLKEIRSARGPEEVAALLASLPPGMDRPDPTGWSNDKSKS